MALEEARLEAEAAMRAAPSTQMRTWRELAATLRLLAHRLRSLTSPDAMTVAAVASLLTEPLPGDRGEPDLWLAAHSVLISLTEPPD
jgi:hypothetical protein